jgi:acetylornithine deacetylase/succinyl-diaminopimelate desuccinylase-like protein
MSLTESCIEQIRNGIDGDRLLNTAVALIKIPSPTRSAGQVADRLAEILAGDGFNVERPIANWPEAPAVAVRFDSGQPGRILQFDGHLDTVHLPFVPPRVENGLLYGSGCSDMKGGIAAFVEALRVLRETDALRGGGVLLTAHDHHEGPWGDRRQLRALIEAGYKGDAVLLPEYLADRLPLAGRGMAIFEITFEREGEPVHEVLRAPGTPDVLGAGAELVCAFREMDKALEKTTDEYAGRDSVFVGQFASGEIYNQSPVECLVKGTRRWVTPGMANLNEREIREMISKVAKSNNLQSSVDISIQGDAFKVSETDPVVTAFQGAYSVVVGSPLPFGGKPFVDDGNTFSALGGIPSLTHGPAATGAHTLNEEVAIDELIRVAQVYALTAVGYCV